MNYCTRFPAGSALLAIALHCACAQAQLQHRPVASVALPSATVAAQLARGDRVFMKDAAENGRFEVEASRLALQRAASPQVRGLAEMMLRDHEAADSGLLRLSQVRGLTPPLMTNGHRKTLNLLVKAQGVGFDRVFVQQAGLQAHQASIRTFELAGKAVKDPELKAWIEATLPLMRNHLAAAQKLAARR